MSLPSNTASTGATGAWAGGASFAGAITQVEAYYVPYPDCTTERRGVVNDDGYTPFRVLVFSCEAICRAPRRSGVHASWNALCAVGGGWLSFAFFDAGLTRMMARCAGRYACVLGPAKTKQGPRVRRSSFLVVCSVRLRYFLGERRERKARTLQDFLSYALFLLLFFVCCDRNTPATWEKFRKIGRCYHFGAMSFGGYDTLARALSIFGNFA